MILQGFVPQSGQILEPKPAGPHAHKSAPLATGLQPCQNDLRGPMSVIQPNNQQTTHSLFF